MAVEINMDALLPSDMAQKAVAIGVKKANMSFWPMFALSVLAGAFIALGAVFATTISAGSTLPFGVTKALTGLAFCLGLILVVVGGAELFTGNNLIIMAFVNRKISFGALLRNWGIVYAGNFVGSVGTAIFMFLGKQYTAGNGVIGLNALNIANAKVNLEFVQAIALGILCNALVCLAVWLCYSARTTTDKILAIIFPITAFVAGGFEHSVANMYFIPFGMMVKSYAAESFWNLPALVEAGKTIASYQNITLGNFLIANLVPVTIGNIIGGAVMVGLVYWFIYMHNGHK